MAQLVCMALLVLSSALADRHASGKGKYLNIQKYILSMFKDASRILIFPPETEDHLIGSPFVARTTLLTFAVGLTWL